jgi:hypothetical protein
MRKGSTLSRTAPNATSRSAHVRVTGSGQLSKYTFTSHYDFMACGLIEPVMNRSYWLCPLFSGSIKLSASDKSD